MPVPPPLTPLDRQRAAIEAPLGPVLVVAGPGAGKTFCLIHRVAYLVETQRFSHERICAVTFTNKAAEEIAIRLKHALGHRAEDVTRGTLHSLCVSVLRELGGPVGLASGFGIADDEYQRAVLRHLAAPRKRWGQLLNLFGRRRLEGLDLAPPDEVLFRRYQAELARRNILDFDDLIARTQHLFAERPEVAATVAGQWDYLLVDEFQDLNPAQFAILEQLVRPHRNLFAVGDDEQSIFSWTGADPTILMRFARQFGVDAPIVLEENHRCSKPIFETARRLLRHNPTLFDKQLRAERDSPFEVTAAGFADEDVEADWIVDDLCRDQAASDMPWGRYAVLYRRHRVGAHLEKRMIRAGIPCRLARGRSLQDDVVVAYVVASLRVILGPDDPRAVEVFAKVLLPDHLYEQVCARAAREDGVFLDAMRAFARDHPREHPDAKKAWRFVYHVENLAAMRHAHDALPNLVTELLSQTVGKYRNVLEERYEDLSDPLADPHAVALADKLRAATRHRTRVWLEPMRGVEIALRGLLTEAGLPRVRYLEVEGQPDADDAIVGSADAGSRGVAITAFKAVQILRSDDFTDVFGDYVAFDLETTDRDVVECDIVEIGAVRVRNGLVVERFHELLKPSRPISAGARAVHGYADDDLRDKPVFAEIWPMFRDFVGPDTLVAHNGVKFDMPVLRRVADGLPGLDDLVFYDTLPLARSLCRDSAKLENLADRFGVSAGRSHHALDDAVTLAGVFSALNRLKLERARKSAAVNMLDYLGVALVLDSATADDEERELFRKITVPFALGRFSDCLEFYANERERLGTRRVPTVDDVIERLGGRVLMARIRATKDPARRYPQSVARIETLVEAAGEGALEDQIGALLQRVALSTSQGAEVDPHRVNLLTLHSTKGLEFSRVYIAGVEDYELPGYFPAVDNREPEIEEARRVLYVGMTRAEDRLILTRADRRFGNATGGSRFLEEMGLVANVDR